MPYSKLNTCFLLLFITVLTIGCGGTQTEITTLPEDTPEVAEVDTTQIDTMDIAEEEIITEPEPEVIAGSFLIISGPPTQLTFADADNGLAAFHPDGHKIVYQSNVSGLWQIYELTLGDESGIQLITSGSNDENPIWTTDGSKIIFVSDRDALGDTEWERDIYAYDVITTEISRLTMSEADDWYPVPEDEMSFLFLSERNSDAALPVHNRSNALYRGFIDGSPSVELAGSSINPSSPIPYGENEYLIRTESGQLGLWDSITNNTIKITPSDLKCSTVAMHPQWEWVVFSAREGDSTTSNLYVFDLATRELQMIPEASGDIRYPQFSPDADSIIYTALTGDKFQIFSVGISE